LRPLFCALLTGRGAACSASRGTAGFASTCGRAGPFTGAPGHGQDVNIRTNAKQPGTRPRAGGPTAAVPLSASAAAREQAPRGELANGPARAFADVHPAEPRARTSRRSMVCCVQAVTRLATAASLNVTKPKPDIRADVRARFKISGRACLRAAARAHLAAGWSACRTRRRPRSPAPREILL